MAAPPPLQLTLSASLPSYQPGDTVTALLHVCTTRPDLVELLELVMELRGVERVDTAWVSASYRKDIAPINTDRRRVQRHVVHAQLQAATQGAFSDGNVRRYLVRLKLPAWLPPSFRGTAVRYTYMLDATMKYLLLHPGVTPPDAIGTPSTPSKRQADEQRGVPAEASTRLLLHLWPSTHSPPGLEPGDAAAGSAAGGAAAGSAMGSAAAATDVFPALLAEDVPLKCWEIGAGTEVRDAVSHIAKLVDSPPTPNASPFSPGRMRRPDPARPDSAELSSEISHDDGPSEPAATPERSRQLSTSVAVTRATSSEAERSGAAAAGALLEVGGGGVRSFRLRMADEPLVRVSVHPPLEGGLQPGSTLAGTLDFQSEAAAGGPASDASLGSPPPLRCMQVTVLLETEECIEGAWRPASKQHSEAGPLRRVYDEHVEVTADTACTHFVFSLPGDGTPSFSTPLLSLRWVLRFQFLARRGSDGPAEQLTWTLPLLVGAPQ